MGTTTGCSHSGEPYESTGSRRNDDASEFPNFRHEEEIFAELTTLCAAPGFVHAIAFLSFRDAFVAYSEQMRPGDMQHLFSRDRLIRSEIATLIGLLIKNDVDYSIPSPDALQKYIDSTDTLIRDLHDCLTGAFFTKGRAQAISEYLSGTGARSECSSPGPGYRSALLVR